MSVVTVGETMAALAPDHVGPLRYTRTMGLSVAGSESTVAIGVRRLGHPAAWIGRIGDDELGALVEMRLRGEGIEVYARRDPDAPTGLMLKERRAAGVRRVHYYRRDSAGSRLSAADLPDGVVESAEVLHVSGITFALGDSAAETARVAIARARDSGVTVSLDLNHRRGLWTDADAVAALDPLLSEVDVLFASADEARLFASGTAADLATALRSKGPGTVVVTLGAEGAVSASAEGALRVPAVPVTEIDPVGAGDSFAAGYLSGLLRGDPEDARLRRATAVAAIAVSTHGDWEGLPTAAELDTVDGRDITR
ncbi:sugar kinase [Amycolatopsis antarctica]|uniref:Sugar kinase n=1 Tax=Amycolatopsis antarctica TaxID=1854586 RepID=A0A263CW33_9PSEU|nr:sugar kinase [Amycolatopsis antarctica]OZM70168.1 sugar kinase [Amycolatopsis antarctica]